jgi:hypothetical protein
MLTCWQAIAKWVSQQPHWTVAQTHACLQALGYNLDALAVAHEINLGRGGASAAIPPGLVDQLMELRDRLGISSVNV